MLKMTAKARKAAGNFAVRYAAYQIARKDQEGGFTFDNDNALIVWGRMVLESQELLGVSLVDVKTTQSLINQAKQRQKNREAGISS